jgi:hypothetical protein
MVDDLIGNLITSGQADRKADSAVKSSSHDKCNSSGPFYYIVGGSTLHLTIFSTPLLVEFNSIGSWNELNMYLNFMVYGSISAKNKNSTRRRVEKIVRCSVELPTI